MFVSSLPTAGILRRLLRTGSVTPNGRQGFDTPLPQLSSHFRYNFTVHNFAAAGFTDNIIRPCPERWGFVVNVCVGTRALALPLPFPGPTLAGVFLIPTGVADKTYGIMVDDMTPPLNVNLNTFGYMSSQSFGAVTHQPGYVFTVTEIIYRSTRS